MLSVVLVLAATACSGASAKGQPTPPGPVEPPGAGLDTATFAGGCFWCMEGPFEKLGGVKSVLAGYSGGSEASPTYEQVSAGRTGHAESVLVTFDPRRISYAELVEVYWRQVDPTDAGGQFADRGKQYRTTIFVHGAEQQRVAEASKQALAASGPFDRPIVTPIVAAGPFWPAEEYHQDFYKKEPERYEAYRQGSGRAPFLARVWGSQKPAAKPVSKPAAEPAGYAKPGDEDLRRRLTPLQYHVTQEDGTERAYANEYWDNKHVGIYVDVVSGEPLFSSQDKFDSGTGWPSFTRPLEPANVAETGDRSRDMFGVEVRSAGADSHLGHLFPDGPPPTRQRYCINSAALRFIPAEDLEREGYGKYSKRFK